MDQSQKFKKYQWIEADIVRDTSDPRPESYKLVGKIKVNNFIDTRQSWKERKKYILGKIYYNLDTLIREAKSDNFSTSLATFKPTKIIDFKIKRKWKNNRFKRDLKSKNLIHNSSVKNFLDEIPYNFYYSIIDQLGKRSTMQIRDWEISNFVES